MRRLFFSLEQRVFTWSRQFAYTYFIQLLFFCLSSSDSSVSISSLFSIPPNSLGTFQSKFLFQCCFLLLFSFYSSLFNGVSSASVIVSVRSIPDQCSRRECLLWTYPHETTVLPSQKNLPIEPRTSPLRSAFRTSIHNAHLSEIWPRWPHLQMFETSSRHCQCGCLGHEQCRFE